MIVRFVIERSEMNGDEARMLGANDLGSVARARPIGGHGVAQIGLVRSQLFLKFGKKTRSRDEALQLEIVGLERSPILGNRKADAGSTRAYWPTHTADLVTSARRSVPQRRDANVLAVPIT